MRRRKELQGTLRLEYLKRRDQEDMGKYEKIILKMYRTWY